MAKVEYECANCGKEVSFETEGQRMLFLDDDIPRPPTYVVDCPYCQKENTVKIENE